MNSTDEKEFLRHLFARYCQTAHEMNAKGFKRLCKDAKLFDKDFLPVDAEIAFGQCMAEISVLDEFDPLRQSVLFGKRIEFCIFFLFLLPDVSELKGISLDNVIDLLHLLYEEKEREAAGV